MAAMTWADGEQWQRPAAVGMTALVVVAGFGRAFGGGPRPGAAMLGLLVLGAIAALVLLLRIELAPWARGAAVAALLLATISCAIRADVYGGHGGAASASPSGTGGSGPFARNGTAGQDGMQADAIPPGAAVALDGGDIASAASHALSGQIAAGVTGAGAWRIEGDLASAGDASMAVTLDWSITGQGDRTACGTLAVHATSMAELYAALAAAFTQAVRGSVRDRRPACV